MDLVTQVNAACHSKSKKMLKSHKVNGAANCRLRTFIRIVHAEFDVLDHIKITQSLTSLRYVTQLKQFTSMWSQKKVNDVGQC